MENINIPFELLYKDQIMYQKKLLPIDDNNIPRDDTKWFSYHMQAMTEELGEVLKADKRWKTHRNETYNEQEKRLEIADVFITAMNLAIYSGMTCEELTNVISKKIKENLYKLY